MKPPGYDITELAGLVFVAKSGNVAHMQLLGERGVRAKWDREPTEDDIRECNAWIERKLDAKPSTFIEGTAGIAEGQRAYKQWVEDATKT